MAIQTTTANLVRQYNAFTGLSAVERSQSGIARAELVYYNVNDTWAAPGVGNNRIYQTGFVDLPKDFGYVLTDAYCRIQTNNARIRANATSALRIFVGGSLGPQITTSLTSDGDRQDQVGSTAIGSIEADKYNALRPINSSNDAVLIHLCRDKPTSLIYPFQSQSYTTTPNPASQWEWTIAEQYENGAAYDVSVYFRFLQYDIDQSYNYVIQSPQLTR
jgi:hypothetical protein